MFMWYLITRNQFICKNYEINPTQSLRLLQQYHVLWYISLHILYISGITRIKVRTAGDLYRGIPMDSEFKRTTAVRFDSRIIVVAFDETAMSAALYSLDPRTSVWSTYTGPQLPLTNGQQAVVVKRQIVFCGGDNAHTFLWSLTLPQNPSLSGATYTIFNTQIYPDPRHHPILAAHDGNCMILGGVRVFVEFNDAWKYNLDDDDADFEELDCIGEQPDAMHHRCAHTTVKDSILVLTKPTDTQSLFVLNFVTLSWSKMVLRASLGQNVKSPVLVKTHESTIFIVIPSEGMLSNGFMFDINSKKVASLEFLDSVCVKQVYATHLELKDEIVICGRFLRASGGALYGKSGVLRLYPDIRRLQSLAEAMRTTTVGLPNILAKRLVKAWRPNLFQYNWGEEDFTPTPCKK